RRGAQPQVAEAGGGDRDGGHVDALQPDAVRLLHGAPVGRVGAAGGAIHRRVRHRGGGGLRAAVRAGAATGNPNRGRAMTNLSAVTSDYRRIGRTTLDVWTHYLSEPSANRGASPRAPPATAMWTGAGEHSAMCPASMELASDFARPGIIIQPEDGNPLSLRPWIEDPRAVRAGDVIDWKTRKRVRTLKVPPYAVGAVIASDGGMFLRFDDPAMCVREWRRRIADDPGYKHGVYLPAKSLRDFLNIYAPPGDTHPVTGLPNENTKYYEVVTTMLERFAAMEADDTSPDPQPDP